MADVNIKYQGTSIATIDASGSKTLQTSGKYCEGDITVEYTDPEKPTQAKSATPTETAQDITPDSGKVLSKVSVGAIPKTYVGSGVTKKAAATVSPSTSEQTVCASGVYTTGAQKVAAITKNLLAQLDPDFVAANIKKDVDLFGLVGTLEAGGASFELPSNITHFAIDKFTAVSNRQDATIGHSLGAVPKIAILFRAGPAAGSDGYAYAFPVAVVFGPAMTSLMATSSAAFDGNLSYSDYSPSIAKRNTQKAMTAANFVVSMASRTDLKAGEYIVITARWEDETQ